MKLFDLDLGMTEVDEIRITSNKIDRIEEHAFPSRNTVTSLILEGNHVLEVPPLSALEDIEVEKVRSILRKYRVFNQKLYISDTFMVRQNVFQNCLGAYQNHGQKG